MPVSKYFKSLSGDVQVPGPDDPVQFSQQGNTTYLDFGVGPDVNIGAAQQYSRSMGAKRPVTQREIGADALMRAQLGVPDIPLDLLQYGTPQGIPAMPAPLAGKPEKPAQSYESYRGGSGKAGRGKGTLPQFGESTFDGYEPLEMPYSDVSDKPYELPDSVNADVQSGTSLTPKPEQNLVDKEPDLQTPQGLYQALAKKYPDILTQNLDQLQKSRITDEDLENLSDRAGLGSLFIAASKAASGAGSIGGKTAESIAPTIVNREDTLARQRLKDRMDVASENMAMNAKAVDLAMKQINFADEREQYDPNSEVSKFARQFMQDEFNLKVPDNVPAYQLKQFLPAVVQKYQAQETGAYRNALLEAQGTARTQQQQAQKTERDTQRQFQETQNKLNRDLQRDLLRERQKGKTPVEKQTPQDKMKDKLIEKDAESYVKRLQGLQKLDGGLQSLDAAKDEKEIVQIGQSLLKTLNDPENSDAVGAEEAKRLANELEMFTWQGASGYPRFGRDVEGFKTRVRKLRERLFNTANAQYQVIERKMPGLVDAPPATYNQSAGGVGLSPEKKARMLELRKKLSGGQ